MADIIINEKFRTLIPPLNKAEYTELEKNLKKEGCREPLVTWNGYLIDGHNRFEICTRLNIKYKVVNMPFESEEDAISWICSNQLGRRSISEETRKYLIGKRYEAEKIIGERQSNRGINQYTPDKKRSVGRPVLCDALDPHCPLEVGSVCTCLAVANGDAEVNGAAVFIHLGDLVFDGNTVYALGHCLEALILRVLAPAYSLIGLGVAVGKGIVIIGIPQPDLFKPYGIICLCKRITGIVPVNSHIKSVGIYR